MFDDGSSLTDVSSSESDFTPSNPKKGPKKRGDYVLKGVLKAPRTSTYAAKALYDQIIESNIDLDPEYQRDVVWPEAKQIGLIDSILRNFYIPPVIFALSISDDGAEKRTCIDGKQRLTSIQKFMDGLIRAVENLCTQTDHLYATHGGLDKDSRTNVKYWYKLTKQNKTGKLLPLQYRNQFAMKQITCVEYEGINDDSEREIFQRVQLGVALTPAERMQATTGPWATLVRELQEFCKSGFADSLEWSSGRGRDFQAVATITYMVEKWPVKTIPGPAGLDRWMQQPPGPSKEFSMQMFDTFNVMFRLASDIKHRFIFQTPCRISPIELIMFAVLVNKKMANLSLTQLSDALAKLRADVRTHHVDIRSNAKVTKTILAFILENFPKTKSLKSDGQNDIPAVVVVKSEKPGKPKKFFPKEKEKDAGAPPPKRKRVGSDDTESDVPLRGEKQTQGPFKKSARTVTGSAIVAQPKTSTTNAESSSSVAGPSQQGENMVSSSIVVANGELSQAPKPPDARPGRLGGYRERKAIVAQSSEQLSASTTTKVDAIPRIPRLNATGQTAVFKQPPTGPKHDLASRPMTNLASPTLQQLSPQQQFSKPGFLGGNTPSQSAPSTPLATNQPPLSVTQPPPRGTNNGYPHSQQWQGRTSLPSTPNDPHGSFSSGSTQTGYGHFGHSQTSHYLNDRNDRARSSRFDDRFIHVNRRGSIDRHPNHQTPYSSNRREGPHPSINHQQHNGVGNSGSDASTSTAPGSRTSNQPIHPHNTQTTDPRQRSPPSGPNDPHRGRQ